MTIKEHAALIPRPKLEAVEVGENQYTFNVASTAIKAVQEPVRSPEVPIEQPVVPALYGKQLFKDTIKAKIFDLRWKTNEYEELEARRLEQRRLQLRQSLGTMPVDRCAKHQHLVDQMTR